MEAKARPRISLKRAIACLSTPVALFSSASPSYARAPESIEVNGVTYCVGFSSSVLFTWPGKNPNNLTPGETGNTGVVMGEWKYDNALWWSN